MPVIWGTKCPSCGERCPKWNCSECGRKHIPDVEDGGHWNTSCPGCGHRPKNWKCPSCKVSSPVEDWYYIILDTETDLLYGYRRSALDDVPPWMLPGNRARERWEDRPIPPLGPDGRPRY
jgi:hypothetical protein